MPAVSLTTPAIAETDRLNEIVARYPQTLPIFHNLGLDTCCGGMHPLKLAAQLHTLDLDKVLALLQAAAEREQE
jgi:iron-sulfur cluster repair protein YtfE (RIC family)